VTGADWQPLQGTKVIDLSQQLPGPFATLLLTALGADVVKVEPPSGDASRYIDPPMLARLCAGKQVIVLNLKDPADRDRLHEMVRETDVVVEGSRPGVMQRLEADWETLSAINPRHVYCSISGAGPTGPLANVPGHDLNFLALAAGLPNGLPDGEALIRIPWVDLASGTNAALTITAALLDRERTGQGKQIGIAMLDSAAIWAATKQPRPGMEGTYGVFATADGERVASACLEEAMWGRLCEAFAWDDWAADPELADHGARRLRGREIEARLRRDIQRLTAAEVTALAERHDLAITAVNERSQVLDQPQIVERGLFPDSDHWRPLGRLGRSLKIDGTDPPGLNGGPA
jgi:crotonobetainyl-CoA:carnitine CoA-transferase CaiB-like acyl-CoA transferase